MASLGLKGKGGSDHEHPVLVMTDRASGMKGSFPVPSKGIVHPYPAKIVCTFLNRLGYSRVNLKSDQEPSIVALGKAAKAQWNNEIILEYVPKGEHQSNGEVERAVQSAHGIARTVKDFLEEKLKIALEPTGPVLAWLVEYSSTLLNLFQVGSDGLTPYHRLKGKPWKIDLPSFGECIEFKKRTSTKLESRWESGLYLGVKTNTTERIVGNLSGIFIVQSVRRKPEEERWNPDLVKGMKGTPWDPNPGQESGGNSGGTLGMPIFLEPECPEVPRVAPETFEKQAQSRKHYIMKSDLDKYGYTPSCPACSETRAGLARTGGVFHSPECRARIENRMAEDPQAKARLEKSHTRQTERLARATQDHHQAERPKQQAPTPTEERSSSSTSPTKKVRIEDPTQRSKPEDEGMGGTVIGSPNAPGSSSGGDRRVEEEKKRKNEEEKKEEEKKRRKDEEKEEEGMEVDERGLKRKPEEQLMPDGDERMVAQLVEETRERYLMNMHESGTEHPVCEEPVLEIPWEVFVDDISGETLDPEGVRKARIEEIGFVEGMGVWKPVPRPKDKKVIGTRWVDTNKGDKLKPNLRSRLVAQELKRGSMEEYFAAMPPLSALRTLMTLAVTESSKDLNGNWTRKTDRQFLSFVDIKRAHFCSKATRELYVELPPEAGYGPDIVGRLLKSMYGCRDAGMNWELEVCRVMKKLGFIQGLSSPCMYYRPTRGIRSVVHGDDFTSLGTKEHLKWFHESLQKEWTIAIRGLLGPPGTEGTQRSISILNRLVSWGSEGITWEGDPRHAEILIRELGVTGVRVKTPSTKDRQPEGDDDEPLDPDQARAYRSLAMRASYLGSDRPDIQQACRELAKGMSSPTQAHWKALKRMGRFLKHRPRLVQHFRNQKSITDLEVWCDADHAGCIGTRKSTTGCVILLGTSTTKTFCRGQGMISLSSGEAEYYGLVSATAEALGEASLLKDWGIKVGVQIYMDATAGISLGSRRGLGRAKHIDTLFLWVQEYVTKGKIKIGKKHTSEMLADFLTKSVPENVIIKALNEMGYKYEEGQHELALRV